MEAKRKFPKVDDLGLTEDIETVVRQLTRLGVATEDDLKLLTKSPKMLSSKMLFALDEEDVDDIVKGMPLGQRRLIKKSIEAEKFDPKKSCTRVIFLVFVVDPCFLVDTVTVLDPLWTASPCRPPCPPPCRLPCRPPCWPQVDGRALRATTVRAVIFHVEM